MAAAYQGAAKWGNAPKFSGRKPQKEFPMSYFERIGYVVTTITGGVTPPMDENDRMCRVASAVPWDGRCYKTPEEAWLNHAFHWGRFHLYEVEADYCTQDRRLGAELPPIFALGLNGPAAVRFLASLAEEAGKCTFPRRNQSGGGIWEDLDHLGVYRNSLRGVAARAYALAKSAIPTGDGEEGYFAGLAAARNILSILRTGEEDANWRERTLVGG